MRVYRTKGGYFYKELKNGKKTRISREQYKKLCKKQTGKGLFSTTHNVTGNNGIYTCSCGENLKENLICPKAPVQIQQMCECSNCFRGYSLMDPQIANYLCRCCGKNFSETCSPHKYTTWAKIEAKCGSTKTWKKSNLTKTWMSRRYSTGQYKICSQCNRVTL